MDNLARDWEAFIGSEPENRELLRDALAMGADVIAPPWRIAAVNDASGLIVTAFIHWICVAARFLCSRRARERMAAFMDAELA